MTRISLDATLASAHLRPTRARRELLQLLSSSGPIDVASISSRLGRSFHLATIYRTLEIFVRSRLVTPVNLAPGKQYYEVTRPHHHHILCSSCGRIGELAGSWMNQVESGLAAASDWLVTGHTLELQGLCTICQKKGHHV